MKAVFILLCLAVAVFAVEVDEDFVKAALDLKRHVLATSNVHNPAVKRAMLNLHGRCNGPGESCNYRVGCCDKSYYCSNWLHSGKCIPKDEEYYAMEAAVEN